MRRLLPFIACLLAVLWLPATVHCGLENAGLLHHGHEQTDSGCATACESDNCTLVESGSYKNSLVSLKVPAPVLAFCVVRLVEIPLVTLVVVPAAPERSDAPPELARTWQFIARTALLPGAPSIAV